VTTKEYLTFRAAINQWHFIAVHGLKIRRIHDFGMVACVLAICSSQLLVPSSSWADSEQAGENSVVAQIVEQFCPQSKNAKECLRGFATDQSYDPQVVRALGQLEWGDGNLDEAEHYLRIWTNLEPWEARAYISLAKLLQDKLDYRTSNELALTSLSLDMSPAERFVAFSVLCKDSFMLGLWADTENFCSKSLRSHTSCTGTSSNLTADQRMFVKMCIQSLQYKMMARLMDGKPNGARKLLKELLALQNTYALASMKRTFQ
jgi:hypothetical protein